LSRLLVPYIKSNQRFHTMNMAIFILNAVALNSESNACILLKNLLSFQKKKLIIKDNDPNLIT
jgi:hypothetical protein